MWRRDAKSNLEHVAPATELLSAYTLTGEPGFLEATRKLADMHGSFPTNKFAARLHRSDLPGWGRQIWVDCMDMDPPFLARLGSITGEETYFRQATEEILCYARLLQDPQSGLFYHGFEESCGQNGQLWARGNGWALMGLVETLKLLPKLDSHQSELTRRLIHNAAASPNTSILKVSGTPSFLTRKRIRSPPWPPWPPGRYARHSRQEYG